MTQLEVQGISRRFGDVAAVDGIDLEVRRGEVCVLLGPSGCGKSTLLRMVAGLETPTGGTVRLEGLDVTHSEPRRRDVAMVFQSYALYPHMTVRQNLSFPLRARRLASGEIASRVGEAAGLLGIDTLLDRKPAALSGGQRQRVAIGRAIVRRPALFLFDEPLSNLDAQLRARMRVELARLFRQLEATVLYVTHDQVEAMTLADRIALMRDGRLEQVGAPEAIYDAPASLFAATFLGSPPMNLIALDGNGAGALAETLQVPAGAATLGVRPEDLIVAPDGPWPAGVEIVENLGAEALVHVRAGAQSLTLRHAGRAPFDSGDTVRIRPRRPHFFDREGRRLA